VVSPALRSKSAALSPSRISSSHRARMLVILQSTTLEGTERIHDTHTHARLIELGIRAYHNTGISYGLLRPYAWNTATLSDLTMDPCLQRMADIYCGNGRVTEIRLPSMKWTTPSGVMPAGFDATILTQLRILVISSNLFSGAIPASLCALTLLQQLYLQAQNTASYDGFTSTPACLSALTNLNTFIANNNALSTMPDFAQSKQLIQIDISYNRVQMLPASFGSWSQLISFTASFNSVNMLPSFSAFTNLTVLYFTNTSRTFCRRMRSTASRCFRSSTSLATSCRARCQISPDASPSPSSSCWRMYSPANYHRYGVRRSCSCSTSARTAISSSSRSARCITTRASSSSS
jgi:hypothetical protein